METFLGITYIQQKLFPVLVYSTSITWEYSYWIFHVGMLVNNIMENKRKFRPAHDLKLMDQVLCHESDFDHS